MSTARPPRSTPPGAHRPGVRRRHSAGYLAGVQSRRWTARALVGAGELLTTAGALLGLMVVWQLWWTDIGANHAQREVIESLAWDGVPVVFEPEGSEAGGQQHPVIPPEAMNRADPPPVIDEPGVGTTFATLYVPRWGQDYVKPISQGVTRHQVLDRLGIGHYPRTAMPGDLGNFAIAGHRTTFGKPFSHIEKLREGNAIVVRTEDTWYVYRVTSTLVVDPHQVGVVAANPVSPGAEPTARMITLTTCHPRYSARLRYIVHGELDYWAPADAGYPPEIVPGGRES